MTDRGKGLSELFGESAQQQPKKDVRTERCALMIVEDDDGDFALVKVDRERGDKTTVLGWLKDRECAEELASIIMSIVEGGAEYV